MRTLNQLLDNITWHTLSGPHAKHSIGVDDVRRYAPGFSPILGFADRHHPNFPGIAPFCDIGEHLYCEGWEGTVPSGWHLETESVMFKMIYEAAVPLEDSAPDSIQLQPQHAQQALDLATLTRPGPFGLRTIQLGDYFGCFDGDRLIAMAGERMFAGTFREISGVCTHPDFQGRGLARKLMLKLIRLQMQRGEKPFLHVLRDNHHARKLYAKMGFANYRETSVRVVSPH